MRDGNQGLLTLTFVAFQVVSLPMRDGNCN